MFTLGIFKHSLSLAKAYVSDVYSRKEQPGIFGKFNAISNAGFIVGPLCGGHLATTDNGFLKVSLLSGSIFFINGFLVYIFFNVDENHPQKKNSSDEIEQTESIDDENQGNLFAIFHNLRQLPWGEVYEILIIRFLMALSVIFFRTSLSLFLVDRYHADPKIIGYILSYSGLLGGLSGFIVGKLSDFYKGNSLRAVLHCDLIAGLSILGCTFSKDLWIFCICLLPLSISTNLARVHFTSILVNSGKDNEHGALIGIGQSIMSLGRMLSPSIVGILQVINIFLPGIVAVIINIVTAIAIVFMMPTRIHSKQE